MIEVIPWYYLVVLRARALVHESASTLMIALHPPYSSFLLTNKNVLVSFLPCLFERPKVD
jgi:hypothetical protein